MNQNKKGYKKVCGAEYSKDIDDSETRKNREMLECIQDLISGSYSVEIITGNTDSIIANAYIIHTKELFIEHKVTKEKVNFYDTLDDEWNSWIFKTSNKKLTDKRFKIDKFGYKNQTLSYYDLMRINEENNYDYQLPF